MMGRSATTDNYLWSQMARQKPNDFTFLAKTLPRTEPLQMHYPPHNQDAEKAP